MNIMIVGCGNVGQTIAQQLNGQGNNLTVIDTDDRRVKNLAGRMDVIGYTGNGATHAVLEAAGIQSAHLLIAVTGSDEMNLLCCLMARKAGNCHTIARVQNPAYSSEAPYLKNELGLSMVINPEAVAADEIRRILRFPPAIQIETFANGRVELLRFRLPAGSPLAGRSVRDVVGKLKCDVLVCTVERGDSAYIGNGNLVFEEKDVLSVVASHRNAEDFFRKIGYRIRTVRNVMIAGGGGITHYLCRELLRAGVAVKIIERDERVCGELSVRFPDAEIIHGDASDRDILLESGIARADAFAALTNLDEENVMLSLFAKSVGCGKVITKIKRTDFDGVVRQLDLDCTVYPKHVTADMIVRYVRAMKNSMGSNVETLYNLCKGRVEAAEFTVRKESAVTAAPISALRIRSEVLIAALLHDDRVVIPRGHDQIALGDKAVVVSKPYGFNDITDILR